MLHILLEEKIAYYHTTVIYSRNFKNIVPIVEDSFSQANLIVVFI